MCGPISSMPPSFFKSIRDDPEGEPLQKGRIEIIQCPDPSALQRQEIVSYACIQLGKPFAELGWRHDILMYAFGLPSRQLHSELGRAFIIAEVNSTGMADS